MPKVQEAFIKMVSMKYIHDTQWVRGKGSVPLQIGLSTFGILALELALIRWTSGQIRIFAYFNNLVLIGAFLGMGIGIALGRRLSGLVHGVFPLLFLLSIPLVFSKSFHLMHMPFPDRAIALWGGEFFIGNAVAYIVNIGIFIFLFCLIVCVFICAGAPVGYLFSKIPPLRAYSADLLGSLLGVVVFTGITFFNAPPPLWLCIGGLPFMWLSRKITSAIFFIGILVLSWYSVNGAVYSPYNRIDIHSSAVSTQLNVNRDFFQYMHNFSKENLSRNDLSAEEREWLLYFRQVYDIPFVVNDERMRALIVGAGTGNDVQAAVRNGYEEVWSVDIDGTIMGLGKALHPERPYDDPRVVPIVNDARAFFNQYNGEPFDVVCYGLLDSHAMFSSMSTLRLDNYVYTEEGIRAAWNHVSPNGHLSITFSIFAGKWIADRLYWTIAKATGKEPLFMFHGMHYGMTFLVAPDMNNLHCDRLAPYPGLGADFFKTTLNDWPSPYYNRLVQVAQSTAPLPKALVKTTCDDWPFLYIKPGQFPWGYIIVLTVVLGLALMATPFAFGRLSLTTDFDPVLFFMGAAFLLIETRGVTSLSLLFGSTWMVNAAIFTGILVMVLLANLFVERIKLTNPLPWFCCLFFSVLLLWAFNNITLISFPLIMRGLLGGLMNALPVGFAGIIISIILSRSHNPAASLGSNLLGSVVGGCTEYFSMCFGLRTLVVLAFIFYLIAFFYFLCKKRQYTYTI